MKADAGIVAGHAYRLALVSFVMALAALLVALVALLDSPWGGRLLRWGSGDAPDNRVIVWPPGGGPPRAMRDLDRP